MRVGFVVFVNAERRVASVLGRGASAIIIGREITMSALREWASAKGGDAHKAVKVNNLGKWKTATQMVAISVLLLVRDGCQRRWKVSFRRCWRVS